jgi:hypothetical protein
VLNRILNDVLIPLCFSAHLNTAGFNIKFLLVVSYEINTTTKEIQTHENKYYILYYASSCYFHIRHLCSLQFKQSFTLRNAPLREPNMGGSQMDDIHLLLI